MDPGSFPRVEGGRGVTLTPHPLLMPSRAIPLLSLRAFVACIKGKTYLITLNTSKLLESVLVYMCQNYKIMDIFNLFFVIWKVILKTCNITQNF
jgi:hypothetical protein